MENTKSSWRLRLYWQTQKKTTRSKRHRRHTARISFHSVEEEEGKKKTSKLKIKLFTKAFDGGRNSEASSARRTQLNKNRILRVLQLNGYNSVMCYEWSNMLWNPVFYAFFIQPAPFKVLLQKRRTELFNKTSPIYSNDSPRVCLPKRHRSVRRQRADATEPINLFFLFSSSSACEFGMEGGEINVLTKSGRMMFFSAVFGNVLWNTSANDVLKKSSPDRNSSGAQRETREREEDWRRGENKNKSKSEVWHLFIADSRRRIGLLSLTLWRCVYTSFIHHNTKKPPKKRISAQCWRL